jgi:hypothetical protein
MRELDAIEQVAVGRVLGEVALGVTTDPDTQNPTVRDCLYPQDDLRSVYARFEAELRAAGFTITRLA